MSKPALDKERTIIFLTARGGGGCGEIFKKTLAQPEGEKNILPREIAPTHLKKNNENNDLKPFFNKHFAPINCTIQINAGSMKPSLK